MTATAFETGLAGRIAQLDDPPGASIPMLPDIPCYAAKFFRPVGERFAKNLSASGS
jgi:hypothetical protein